MRFTHKRCGLLISAGVALAFAFLCAEVGLAHADEPTPASDVPQRLKRSESFFGVHFDFHAGKGTPNIGATTTPEMVQAIIDSLHPDFIQVDSKGHPGLTSYPTKVGNPAPGVVADSLKIWREVTARNGVALYTHYSGVWDNEAVALHPEWAVTYSDGSRSKEKTSVFGDYATKLLIPQILEKALVYGTDGVWIDGECWATELDYSEKAKEAFKAQTGIENIPTGPGQEGWLEWRSFHQEAFRQYLRNYVDAIKSKAPNFQVASNWAFTDHMPDPVSANVNFISGDYSPNDSVTAARYSSRLMSTQNMPWDLMAWSFALGTDSNNGGRKTGVQLSREAACVLAQGGAFQAYITQNPDGSVNLDKLPPMHETAEFCRARQHVCQYSSRVQQVVLYCPTRQHYANVAASGGSLFPMITWQRPILKQLLKLNYAVEIEIDETLCRDLESAPVVVFYRGALWSDELKNKILDYVKKGGNVVLIGNEPLSELSEALTSAEKVSLEQIDDVWFLDIYKLGAGKIIVYPTPVGSPDEFSVADGPTFTRLLEKAMAEAFPKPIVQFAQKYPLDVSVRKTQDGDLSVHLVNVSGPHESAGVIESIDPVKNVEVMLNLNAKPKRIRLEPSGTDLDFSWEDNQAKLSVTEIPIYEILVIEE